MEYKFLDGAITVSGPDDDDKWRASCSANPISAMVGDSAGAALFALLHQFDAKILAALREEILAKEEPDPQDSPWELKFLVSRQKCPA